MKIVNKELGILVDMSERQARICLKRNPRKYTLPESVEEVELEDEEETEQVKAKTQTLKPNDHVQPLQVSGSVIDSGVPIQVDTELDAEKASTGTIEDINASVDASKGAKDMANKNGINLNDLGISGRIMKTDVENYLSSK